MISSQRSIRCVSAVGGGTFASFPISPPNDLETRMNCLPAGFSLLRLSRCRTPAMIRSLALRFAWQIGSTAAL